MARAVAIVQARLGSSRLPLKSMVSLKGLPIIDWVTKRIGSSQMLDDIVVAIPDTSLDKALARHLQTRGVNYIAGPENDVLARMIMAADASGAEIVVRVCADNPLVSGEAIDQLLRFFLKDHCDYAYNHIPRQNLWPDGFGAEAARADLLRKLGQMAVLPSQREHCFNYLWDHADDFGMATFDPPAPLRRPEIRLDIDTPADYARLASLAIRPDMDMCAIVEAWDEQNP